MAKLNLKESFVLAWGLAYIACSVLKPSIHGTSAILGIMIMIPWGSVMITGLFLSRTENYKKTGAVMLLIIGILEVFGGVASWTGLNTWHINLGNRTLLQVSMATYDFVAAIVLLNLGTERLTPAFP